MTDLTERDEARGERVVLLLGLCLECGAEVAHDEVHAQDCKHREAACGADCGRTTRSRPGLGFFRALPEEEFDEYYCGCWEGGS